MDQTLYKQYTTLKNKLDYTYKGYNLKNLVPGYLNFIFAEETPPVKEVAKAFFKSTQSIDLRKVSDCNSSVVLSQLINRSDYTELVEAAKKDYDDATIIDLSKLPIIKLSPFSFSYLKHFAKASKIIFTRNIEWSFMTKLYLIALLTMLFNHIKLLSKKEPNKKIKKYICFNSAYKDESLLTEYFNQNKVETITLQHGIFCDFKLFIPFDVINFDNLLAKKVLCWGQSTIDYLSQNGFDKSRLILKGNPKYTGISLNNKSIDLSFTRCLVLLGRGIYTPTNEKLLKILSEYNRTHDNKILFYLKKHPFLLDSDHKTFGSIDNKMIFLGKEHSVQEILKSDLVDFSIAVNTTAYYESLALGKVSLRWVESENEEFHGMDDKFKTLDELNLKIDFYRYSDPLETREKMNNVIKYVFKPNGND